jgi:hypothetical protein
MVDKLSQTNHISIVRFTNLKLFLGILCLVAVVLVPAQMAHARGFMLKVNLFDGKVDSGKVTVFVVSEATDKKKSKSLDVGRIAAKTGDSTIERLAFKFTDIQLPPNGAFSAYIQRIMVRRNVNKLTDTMMRPLLSCGSKCHANI